MSARRSTRLAARLLGRHVARIAEGHAQRRLLGLGVGQDQLGQAEVEQLDEVGAAALRGEEDVARPQVAVDVAEARAPPSAPRRSASGCRPRARSASWLLALEHLGRASRLRGTPSRRRAGRRRCGRSRAPAGCARCRSRRRWWLRGGSARRACSSCDSCGVQHLDRDLLAQRGVLAAIDRAGAALRRSSRRAGSDRR